MRCIHDLVRVMEGLFDPFALCTRCTRSLTFFTDLLPSLHPALQQRYCMPTDVEIGLGRGDCEWVASGVECDHRANVAAIVAALVGAFWSRVAPR